MNRINILCVLIGFLAIFSRVSFAQDLGCNSEVSLDGGVVKVSASSSGDDTENVQCALEAAVSGGYREVYLTSKSYSISGVEIANFQGDFRGNSIATTEVTVANGSLNCEKGAALRFNRGSPKVTRMTLKMDEPCISAGGSASVVGFYTNPAKCSQRVVTGVVERVFIEGGGASTIDFTTGITIDTAPECFPADPADPLPGSSKALGGLRVNRCEIRDLDIGILASVSDGGQVDITSNSKSGAGAALERLGMPISIVDANQNTNIFRNEIAYNDVEYSGGLAGILGTTGIYVGSSSASPSSNKTAISKNTFRDGGVHSEGYGFLAGKSGKSMTHEVVLSGNTFNGSDDNTAGAGVAVLDTSKGLISGNSFKGSAFTWIQLDSGDPDKGGLNSTVAGWAIVSNSFSASTATTDITLGSKTEDNVVGSSQNSPVVDDLGSNDVLESAASSSKFLGSAPISVGSEILFERQLQAVRGRDVAIRKLGR
ncbi:MAG: hypothetical protein P8H30_06245 [Luminiphilus sp.]|nr:hypothetical protein [Luminiphilus sp.]MDG1771545.1 hypothetical protein [Luminiphilus sp.]MDG2443802.1 hypothetical protein [Luminiphilus sp.]